MILKLYGLLECLGISLVTRFNARVNKFSILIPVLVTTGTPMNSRLQCVHLTRSYVARHLCDNEQ